MHKIVLPSKKEEWKEEDNKENNNINIKYVILRDFTRNKNEKRNENHKKEEWMIIFIL